MNEREYFKKRVISMSYKTDVEILEHYTIEDLDALHRAAGLEELWRSSGRREDLIRVQKELTMPCHTKHKFGLKYVINDGVKLYTFECVRCQLKDIIVAKLFWRRTA